MWTRWFRDLGVAFFFISLLVFALSLAALGLVVVVISLLV